MPNVSRPFIINMPANLSLLVGGQTKVSPATPGSSDHGLASRESPRSKDGRAPEPAW